MELIKSKDDLKKAACVKHYMPVLENYINSIADYNNEKKLHSHLDDIKNSLSKLQDFNLINESRFNSFWQIQNSLNDYIKGKEKGINLNVTKESAIKYIDSLMRDLKFEIEIIKPEIQPVKNKVLSANENEIFFYKNGCSWVIGFENVRGKSMDFELLKGITYIHRLLSFPKKPFSYTEIDDLESKSESPQNPQEDMTKYLCENNLFIETALLGDPQEKSKKLVIELYRLKNAYEQAEENNSPDASILKTEYEKFKTTYNELYDKKGNPREDNKEFKNTKERVKKCIKEVKEKILSAFSKENKKAEYDLLLKHFRQIKPQLSDVAYLPSDLTPIELKSPTD